MRGSTPCRAALCVKTKRPESIWRGHEHPEWFSHCRWGWRLCHCRDPHPSFAGGSRIENRTMQGRPHWGRQNHPQRLTFWLHSADRSTRLCREMPCHPLTDPELEEQLTCDPDTQIQGLVLPLQQLLQGLSLSVAPAVSLGNWRWHAGLRLATLTTVSHAHSSPWGQLAGVPASNTEWAERQMHPACSLIFTGKSPSLPPFLCH